MTPGSDSFSRPEERSLPPDGKKSLTRVLRALALSREPGLNFPAYFLELSYDGMPKDGARVSMDTGAHNADADGQMNIGALGLLADMSLAASLRSRIGVWPRIATVSMSLQFPEARRIGRLRARSSFDGFIKAGAERQGLARVVIRSAGDVVCTGSAAFIILPPLHGITAHPLPRRGEQRGPSLDPAALKPAEKEVYRRARESLEGPAARSFIERFWGYQPRRTAKGAACSMWNGPHVGNRFHHAQGGLTFGLAASTAAASLGAEWRLVGASAWYLSPGVGQRLRAQATIVHRGLLTAVVRTRITDGKQTAVLEAVTSHARR